ncbi:MAG: bifunctional phosphoribosylaminoimidazolecarboxamide formyltransferase/IMP cyclohydrolase, partial [Pyrinomonadaceae bacterium]|nr:bifunctional phosphoribosylaminoimidazolecarboxamide formyltransferase/IMP cyclohydrolase [Pyrinomonadaceae bacterium]
IEILSTGGTAKVLREAGIEVRDVADVTGFPEMLDGRVKTLHPRIHGGLLAVRDNQAHTTALAEHGIEPIDMVVINLYPFEETVERGGVALAEAVEQIDIGGPAMIRSAAKNFQDVAVVVAPEMYEALAEELSELSGSLPLSTRQQLALAAFGRTSEYDRAVALYLAGEIINEAGEELFGFSDSEMDDDDTSDEEEIDEMFPPFADLMGERIATLRYGENPHQQAALYRLDEEEGGVANAAILAGKEMSFNNYIDADAAWQLVRDFDQTACAIIKHTNPSGVGVASSVEEAYRRALATDPVSAFGGIVAFNRKVDAAAAQAVTEIFTEVVIAPDYEADALETLRAKKNLRVLRINEATGMDESEADLDLKKISGGLLLQTPDMRRLTRDMLQVVTQREPTEAEFAALLFAWTVCKHTKSNAIVYARDGQTIGVGAGQMSRVDAVRLGAMRAQLPVRGSVLASDAFFPFRDGIDEAAKHGITAVIQPGGSVRDAEVIAAAAEHNLAMVFTGIRHFKH